MSEEDLTPSEKEYLRLSRLTLLGLFAVSAVIALFPAGRFGGMAGAALCLLFLIYSYLDVSLKVIGWTSILIGSAVAMLATYSSADTLVAVLGSSVRAFNPVVVRYVVQDSGGAIIAVGFPLILTNRAEARIKRPVQIAGSVCGLLAAIGYGVIIFMFPSHGTIDGVGFALLLITAIGADVSPPNWKLLFGIPLLVIVGELLGDQLYPAWRTIVHG